MHFVKMSGVALGRNLSRSCHRGWRFEICWVGHYRVGLIGILFVLRSWANLIFFLVISWNNGDGPFALRRRLWEKNLRLSQGLESSLIDQCSSRSLEILLCHSLATLGKLVRLESFVLFSVLLLQLKTEGLLPVVSLSSTSSIGLSIAFLVLPFLIFFHNTL